MGVGLYGRTDGTARLWEFEVAWDNPFSFEVVDEYDRVGGRLQEYGDPGEAASLYPLDDSCRRACGSPDGPFELVVAPVLSVECQWKRYTHCAHRLPLLALAERSGRSR